MTERRGKWLRNAPRNGTNRAVKVRWIPLKVVFVPAFDPRVQTYKHDELTMVLYLYRVLHDSRPPIHVAPILMHDHHAMWVYMIQ
jgi:hypothetical protein